MGKLQKILVGATFAVATTLGATASNAAVSIVNGSFESGINPGSYTSLATGDNTSITGWTVGGLGIDYIGSYWQAADGVRSIDLSGNNHGSISQMLTGLTIGQLYAVSFALAGNPDGGGATKVAVASDGGSQAEVFNFLQAGNTKDNMGWINQVFTFTATGASANLTFSGTQDNAYGPALDNVSISAAIPEPATWAMMISGFGLIGLTLRRRRTVLAA